MTKKAALNLPVSGETKWLGRVREVRHPIDPARQLTIEHQRITKGGNLARPSISSPERHPYCEFSYMAEGECEQYIGMEKVTRTPGDMMLLGPDIPHDETLVSYPVRVIVVHFLPVLLFELGSGRDGARILSRFTASRSISQRVVRPPKPLQKRFADLFENMAREFDRPKFGSDMGVRARLTDALVELLRWEDSAGKALPYQSMAANWGQIEKALDFIHRHYAESLYIEQIARDVGLSPENLHRLFLDTFGMSCVQYLRAYRISRAASLLCLPGARVAEVAFQVGFETLGHFNTCFRRLQGMSPRDYMRTHKSSL